MTVNAQSTKLGKEPDNLPSLERRHLPQEPTVIPGNSVSPTIEIRAEDAAKVRAHGKGKKLPADQKKVELEIRRPSSRSTIVLTPVAGPKR